MQVVRSCKVSNTSSSLVLMHDLVTDRFLGTQTTGAARPVHSWRLTAGEQAIAAAEMKQAAPRVG
jgi:hypothetical protein